MTNFRLEGIFSIGSHQEPVGDELCSIYEIDLNVPHDTHRAVITVCTDDREQVETIVKVLNMLSVFRKEVAPCPVPPSTK